MSNRDVSTTSSPRPFPSLTHGVLHSTAPLNTVGSSLNRGLHLLLVFACQLLAASIRAVARIGSALQSERQSLGREMLMLTSFLQAASWAATTAHHLRSMATRSNSQAETCYLLRQTEAISVQLGVWMAHVKPSAAESVALMVTQAMAFFTYLCLMAGWPPVGHVLVEFLAEVIRRRFLVLLYRLQQSAAWAGDETSHLPASFWNLPEGARLEEIFEAMQQDVAYIATVNAALTNPDCREDLAELLSPSKAAKSLTSISQTPPGTSRINPLFGKTPSESPEETLESNQTPPPATRQRPSSSGRQANGHRGWWSKSPVQSGGPLSKGSSSTERPQRLRRPSSGAASDSEGSGRSPLDDDAASLAGSAVSSREVRTPVDVLEEMEKMWARK